LPKDSKFILYKQTSPEIGFEPDRALVNYNVKDGDILGSKANMKVQFQNHFEFFF